MPTDFEKRELARAIAGWERRVFQFEEDEPELARRGRRRNTGRWGLAADPEWIAIRVESLRDEGAFTIPPERQP